MVSVGCGPSVDVDDGGPAGSTSGADDGSSVTSPTSAPDPSDPTNATTATTSPTTNPTSATTADTGDGTFGDDTSDDGDDTFGDFIMSPDNGTSCSSVYQCDVWAQDCPDGEKCMPWACGDHDGWNASRCSALDDDPAQVGEPCTVVDGPFSGVDDCDISAMCWNPDPDTLVGECIAFCSGSEANRLCEDPATVCFQGYDTLIACLPACDPLVGDCDPGEQCMFDGEDYGSFVCMPDFLVGAQAYGHDCAGLVGCGTGLVCRPAADVPGCATTDCCTELHDVGQPIECPDASQTCLPMSDGQRPPWLADFCYCGVEA